jgi:septal ring factor EnvC (AmiA/AmiB activator)
VIKTLNEQDILKFKDLSEEEKTRRGILGTLFGPIASVVKCTRNGRKYPDEVWEKVFDNDIVKEMLEAGGIPGELDHPQDRSETCSEKIAIMMPEAPKKDDNGHLVARFDIIDTPMGRIAAALARYGFKFGISSRGTGDTFDDYDGTETVDADTYDFQAFDLVLLPACEDARLKLAESFDVKKIRFKKELKEALAGATEEQKKVIEETLENLDIDYNSEKSVNKKSNSDEEADNDGAEVMRELQESLKAQRELEKQVKVLQEKLSVCYTKESRYIGALSKAKSSNDIAVSTNKKLQAEVASLKESLKAERELSSKSKDRIASMRDTIKSAKGDVKTLTESLQGKDDDVKKLQESLNSLKETYNKRCNELKTANDELRESLNEAQKDAKIARNQATAQAAKHKELVERYKAIAKTAVDKYITSQATRLGISATDIKKNLRENYSFSDIDKVCEELQQYKLNMKSLPFDISTVKKPVSMTIKESKEPIKRGDTIDGDLFDDGIDDMLKGFI